MNLGNRKLGKRIVILPILLLLLFQFTTVSQIVKATSLLTANADIQVCYDSNGCSFTVPIDTVKGDLLIAVITCQDYGSPVQVIGPLTDSVGNIWEEASSLRMDTPNTIGNETTPTITSAFYALASFSDTVGTVTLSLASVSSFGCNFYMEDDSIHVSQYQLPNSVVSPVPSSFGSTPPFNFNATAEPCLNPCTGNEFFFNYIVMAYNSSYGANIRPPTVGNVYNPLVTTYPNQWVIYNGFPLGFSTYASQTFLSSTPSTLQLLTQIKCTDTALAIGCNHDVDSIGHAPAEWDIGELVLPFSVGQTTNFCYNVQNTLASMKDTTTTTPLIGYVSYVGWFTYMNSTNNNNLNNPVSTATVTGITLDVKNVSGLLIGETVKLTLALYIADSSLFNGYYSFYQTGTGPFPAIGAVLAPIQFNTWILTNTIVAKNYTLGLQYQIPNGALALLVVTTTHNGVTVFDSKTTGNPIALDSSDGFSQQPNTPEYSVLPVIINNLQFNYANLNLWANVVVQCNNNIFQEQPHLYQPPTNGSGIIVNPLNCSTGGYNFVNFNGLVKYWPIWILPVIMGGLFGLIGLFMGLFLGMVVGTASNIVPTWADIMIFLGVILIMVRREI